MTTAEIIAALKENAKPFERHFIPDDVRLAMMNHPNPGELVAPILEIIGMNPTADFGMPGDLIHFVECFSNKGYEELLIDSVMKMPTAHNIWMVHRCFNDPKDPRRDAYKMLVSALKQANTTPADVKAAIDEFTWE